MKKVVVSQCLHFKDVLAPVNLNVAVQSSSVETSKAIAKLCQCNAQA
jgi:hypothetical protein